MVQFRLPEVDVLESVAEILAGFLLRLDRACVGVVADSDVLVSQTLGRAAGHVRRAVVLVVGLEPICWGVLGEESGASRRHERGDSGYNIVSVESARVELWGAEACRHGPHGTTLVGARLPW